jgi:hypothetical protein
MSNSNSASGFSGSTGIRNQFSAQTVSTATETPLVVVTNTGTATAFVVAPALGSIRGAANSLNINQNKAIIGRSQYEYGIPNGETNDQFSSASWDGIPFKVRISGIGNAAAQLATPVNDTFVQADTGGTLTDSTLYYYRVVAINAQSGASLASTETSLTTSGSGVNKHTMTVKWLAVAGATGYKVYGRTTGGELLMATVGNVLLWVDDGSITPAGALPTSATSQITLNMYQGTSSTLASDKAIGTTGAQTIAAAGTGGAFNFEIEAHLIWDSASGILSGSYKAGMGWGSSSSFTTQTVVTNVVTGLTVAGLSFLASVTFGFASASNTVTVKDFVLDRL